MQTRVPPICRQHRFAPFQRQVQKGVSRGKSPPWVKARGRQQGELQPLEAPVDGGDEGDGRDGGDGRGALSRPAPGIPGPKAVNPAPSTPGKTPGSSRPGHKSRGRQRGGSGGSVAPPMAFRAMSPHLLLLLLAASAALCRGAPLAGELRCRCVQAVTEVIPPRRLARLELVPAGPHCAVPESHNEGGQDAVPEPLGALGAAAGHQAPPQLGAELMGKGLLQRSRLQPSVDDAS
ncbi:uncharacterized protein LOC118251662 isoform X1 [Cygnus atratus]|uniref:uncharacterized protein LOC118251662 isoform X1 n=1 Tax=Cygnus atratus TaxID=8868 RepID=UPI0021B78826|nr:uncharacterized protein LOC118251662 isoform X1 [Cygnus atratus]